MTIKDMHYDFKKKLNKVDSQQYRNLLIPEIDWALNEAQNVFVDIVSEPRLRTNLGFEKSQKNIDDIRTLVISDLCSTISNTATIPEYNIVNHNKVIFLKRAKSLFPNYSHYSWIDFGFLREDKYIISNFNWKLLNNYKIEFQRNLLEISNQYQLKYNLEQWLLK